MLYTVSHTTTYNYDAPVSYCHNIAVLKPRKSPGQELLQYKMQISPEADEISERVDFFGNYITRFSIQKEHKELKVTTVSKLERDYDSQRESFRSEACTAITLEQARKTLQKTEADILEAKQFVLESIFIRHWGENIREYAKKSFTPGRSVFEAAEELMQRIYVDFDFVSGFTSVSTPINEVMQERKGVCQDFAQIAIACIRSIGLPARYISGYIETLPPPGREKLVGADASHAWFSIFIPGFGWVDFDPTNNQIPGNQHLVTGWGRDYYDVPPLKGVVYGSGRSKLNVEVDIARIS
ncbi:MULTISPECIES: transglutaminase family protein [unclassified Leeuwenhoekiella]|uniref:transglutaminase family protein n=1 Tax=unclassified Leeuwenhoekiella TaxID=2615029 RepID=UPI000C4C0382|nr:MULTISPECIES: transglutaminase family protein [unclassified Leeuwenhoekiella]MAW93768.1 transglutaminase [Leeuwenhoekiella sp.]MBA80542.1 transglutaminase [Leeuwenhoekiella sp.]|tara:strand:+ start:19363 stop:20253 length:891 start_codon:yes stop_codon:yes gene_type:complete